MIKRYFSIFLLCTCSFLTVNAQTVTISPELSIRNDKAYDIIGKIDNNILVFRDKGDERIFEVFDMNMKYLYDQDILFDEKRSDIYAVAPQDTSFTVMYGYRKKKRFYLKAMKIGSSVIIQDTTSIIDGVYNYKVDNFKHVLSEDGSKTLLFATSKGDLLFTYVIDNATLELIWSKETILEDYDLRKDFKMITLSNNGEVNVLFELHNTKYGKKKHHLVLLGLDSGEGYYENKFLFEDKMTVDLEMTYDNINNRIVLGGLLSEDSEFDATGYFYFTEKIDDLKDTILLKTNEFSVDFLSDLYGKKLGKKKKLDDFITRDIILKGDGGFLLVTEMNREFYRRSAFNGSSRYFGNRTGNSGWLDIYNEDIIVFSFHADGTEHWKKILYKKQFSQDDGGVYSSFFVFKTPSRMRLIYNDEIKKNNTVSEYVLDPMGNFERNSLLNTDYQNLKLRFKDAKQISSNIMIVPSERNFKLNLVKIEY